MEYAGERVILKSYTPHCDCPTVRFGIPIFLSNPKNWWELSIGDGLVPLWSSACCA